MSPHRCLCKEPEFMSLALFAASAVGLVLLIISIAMLVSPFVGWKCRFDASIPQITADIPKAGRYSINIKRDKYWLLKEYGSVNDIIPRVNYSIQRLDTGEEIEYVRNPSLFTSNTFKSVTKLVGYFDAPDYGKYLIKSLSGSRYNQNEEVVIRQYISGLKMFLLIFGICISSNIFLLCLIFGLLNMEK